MKSDDTLLIAPGIPTVDDLKAYFQANDFTAYANGMAVQRLAPSEERTYGKIKKCFSDYWNSSLKSLGVEQFGRYFSSDSPITVLKSADSKIVISKVLEIQRDDTLTEQYYDAFFTIVEDQLTEKVKAYAKSVGKDADELSDDEVMMCVDEMSDALLSKMMFLLQQTQSVPEIAQIQRKRVLSWRTSPTPLTIIRKLIISVSGTIAVPKSDRCSLLTKSWKTTKRVSTLRKKIKNTQKMLPTLLK